MCKSRRGFVAVKDSIDKSVVEGLNRIMEYQGKTVVGSVAVNTTGGTDAMIKLLEEALAAAKENPQGFAAGVDEEVQIAFERVDLGGVFTMAHRC